jgi:alpha-glucosidase
MSWWRNAVIYQIYPRSFADSNGDGVGDIPGITSKLDYLAELGVDAIWLNPITRSPNVDWGYDVADYCDVDPALGTLDDVDALIAAAGERGIRVVLDIVPNHTSIDHPWFRERPDFYVWADEIPNNWRAAFGGGPAWTKHGDRYYLHNFAAGQPDLDWWNPAVREEFEQILRFWFDRGVAGFRIDVAHALVKDRELRDDSPATEEDSPSVQRGGLKHDYSMNRPEVHDIWRRWREIADAYEPPRVLLGEAYVLNAEKLAKFYGSDDELNMVFAFKLMHAPFEAERLRAVVEEIEAAFPGSATPVWTGSNHDDLRLATRWAKGDERKARMALLMLLTLRGSTVLYMGDELALENGSVPPDRVLDCAEPSRDPGRTPFPWTREGAEWRDPWLPFTPTPRNAAESETLAFTRALIRLKREVTGSYESVPSPPGTWIYRRGSGHTVVLCFEGRAAVEGETLLAVGEPGKPWSAALVR